jgi:cell division protein FtsZ
VTLDLNAGRSSESLSPRIVVFGVGGAGGNAVNNMIDAGLEGVEFVAANTDAQQLSLSKADRRIQLGVGATQGLGAGAQPQIGAAAAEESLAAIVEHLDRAHMVFITAGMGGGTGTGAAPIIAKYARERGILTVGVVTKPFHFEGRHRMRLAEAGIAQLRAYTDTLIVVPNQNLFRVATARTTFADAFRMADEVLHSGVRSVTDLIVLPGLINLDFADVLSVMAGMGEAMMGTGEATGENRALVAAERAIENPLVDASALHGAKAVLVNVTGGPDMTLMEIDEAANAISREVDPDANIIFGASFHPSLEGTLRVSVIATGMAKPPVEVEAPAASAPAAVEPAPADPAPVDPAPAPAQPLASTSGRIREPDQGELHIPPRRGGWLSRRR